MLAASHSDALRLNPIDTTIPSGGSVDTSDAAMSSYSKSPTEKSSLQAAAELIQTLDTAFAEMNTLAATSARDADEARKNARAASEVARRFSCRSYPKDTNDFDVLTPTISTPRPTKFPAVTGSAATSAVTLDIPLNGTPDVNASNKNNMNSASARKRKTYSLRSSPSSAERLAQSHAEDVLSLSLELERSKQLYESEKTSHEETKSCLAEAKSKNAHLEQQIQKLLNDMETQRESHGRTVDSLEKELDRAKVRVKAAEEDAQLALELAKGNAESREQLEGWLQRALMEVQVLREQLVCSTGKTTASTTTAETETKASAETTSEAANFFTQTTSNDAGKMQATPPPSTKTVRFADSPIILSESTKPENKSQVQNQKQYRKEKQETRIVQAGSEKRLVEKNKDTQMAETTAFSTPTRSRPSRSLVAAGRNILQRSLATNKDDPKHSFEYTPERSAQRRQRLRDHLRRAEIDVTISSPPGSRFTPDSTARKEPNFTDSMLGICRSAVTLLQSSAKRLGLGGHWWRDQSQDSSQEISLETLENLTRHYCQSVEVKIERQRTEIKELESLCSFLEQRISSNVDDSLV